MKKYSLPILLIALLVITNIAVVGAQWQPPTELPPGGNVAAPLNVGKNAQTKNSALGINMNRGSMNLIPGAALHIRGGSLVINNDNSQSLNTAWEESDANLNYAIDTPNPIVSHGFFSTDKIFSIGKISSQKLAASTTALRPLCANAAGDIVVCTPTRTSDPVTGDTPPAVTASLTFGGIALDADRNSGYFGHR